MQIYLAGGITGNLFPLWKKWGGDDENVYFGKVMKLYLAGQNGKATILRDKILRNGKNENLSSKPIVETIHNRVESKDKGTGAPITIIPKTNNNDIVFSRGTSREERNNNDGASAEQNRTDDDYP